MNLKTKSKSFGRAQRALGLLTAATWLAGLTACEANSISGQTQPPPKVEPPVTPPPGPPPAPPPPTVQPPPPAPTFPVGKTPVGEAKECEVDHLDPPQIYGNKVKALLTGLPMSQQELSQLEQDPASLPRFVDAWLAMPEAQENLQRFFKIAFQQDQVTNEGIMTFTGSNNVAYGRFGASREQVLPLLISNIEQSFSRTALKLVQDGRPFNEVLTTDTFEMTTALKLFYAFLDHRNLNEAGDVVAAPMPGFGSFVGLRNFADEAPPEEVLDPNSPNFMRIYLPRFDDLCLPANVDEFPFQQNALNRDLPFFVFRVIMGRTENVRNRAENATCRARPRAREPLLSQSDFSDWTTVRIRKPQGREQTTRFYDLVGLRSAQELVLRTDRIGFFSTVGFFGTWPTNEDNASRVTINQTLITALGASFDGVTVTDFSPPALDEQHSAPGSTCFGCHQTLDPMREFFRKSYSHAYGVQDNQERLDAEAHFVFRGVQATGQNVQDLAGILANHPDFSGAWAQKLCYYANSAPCPEGSEAFTQVVQAFEQNNLDFRVLIRELFSSPLVTNASCYEGSEGFGRSIARRDQFCSKLSNRLGVDDICALETPLRERNNLQRAVLAGMASIPADTFSRGEPDPITISDTGLFTRATREVVCVEVGELAFDDVFGGMEVEPAIEKMVTEVIGLSSGDARHAEALQILRDHVSDGMDEGANQRNVLRSALVVACMSPGVAGMGF